MTEKMGTITIEISDEAKEFTLRLERVLVQLEDALILLGKALEEKKAARRELRESE